MTARARFFSAAFSTGLLSLLGFAASARAGTLQVVSTSPARHAGTAATATTIAITFNLPLNPATIGVASFRAYGRWSGPVRGTFTFSNANQTVTLTPDRPFSAGETVLVNLANTIAAADTSPLRTAGYAYSFVTRAGVASRIFDEIDTISVRTTASGTRLYGGAAIDLDQDGWLDLATVNEDSGDVRVLMNRADGSGLYDLQTPPSPIGLGGSPNEPGDYNNDDKADLATANYEDSTVSVLLGQGNGSFGPQQSISTANIPHGLAALDVDGDADWDLVTANLSANNLSRLLNNGSGVFGTATNFDSTGDGEYAVFPGDMNNDGITDLVVGTRNDQQVHVLTGNGNGTFTHASNRSAGGLVWMIALGDVNGDGNLDVATANSQSDNGAILLGNGNGTLQAAQTYTMSGDTVATDLGDLDGDGDLDWLVSSFGGSRWHLMVNNGSGTFTPEQEFAATSNASCAILIDIDNDGDLDITLFDEIADEVKLEQNTGAGIFADGFETGNTAAWSVTVP